MIMAVLDAYKVRGVVIPTPPVIVMLRSVAVLFLKV